MSERRELSELTVGGAYQVWYSDVAVRRQQQVAIFQDNQGRLFPGIYCEIIDPDEDGDVRVGSVYLGIGVFVAILDRSHSAFYIHTNAEVELYSRELWWRNEGSPVIHHVENRTRQDPLIAPQFFQMHGTETGRSSSAQPPTPAPPPAQLQPLSPPPDPVRNWDQHAPIQRDPATSNEMIVWYHPETAQRHQRLMFFRVPRSNRIIAGVWYQPVFRSGVGDAAPYPGLIRVGVGNFLRSINRNHPAFRTPSCEIIQRCGDRIWMANQDEIFINPQVTETLMQVAAQPVIRPLPPDATTPARPTPSIASSEGIQPGRLPQPAGDARRWWGNRLGTVSVPNPADYLPRPDEDRRDAQRMAWAAIQAAQAGANPFAGPVSLDAWAAAMGITGDTPLTITGPTHAWDSLAGGDNDSVVMDNAGIEPRVPEDMPRPEQRDRVPAQQGRINWDRTDRHWQFADSVIWPVTWLPNEWLYNHICTFVQRRQPLHRECATPEQRDILPECWLRDRPTFRALVQEAIHRAFCFPTDVFNYLRDYLLSDGVAAAVVASYPPWRNPIRLAAQLPVLQRILELPLAPEQPKTTHTGRNLRSLEFDPPAAPS